MAEQDRAAAAVRRGETDRVTAFTDGVFAIIITILVLEINVPPNLSEQSLAESLRETGPELSAWVISFLITGMYWVWHTGSRPARVADLQRAVAAARRYRDA